MGLEKRIVALGYEKRWAKLDTGAHIENIFRYVQDDYRAHLSLVRWMYGWKRKRGLWELLDGWEWRLLPFGPHEMMARCGRAQS